MNPLMTAKTTSSKVVAPFRPRARLLHLLGDELIGSPRLAVFELVKNAYDADAREVVVRLALVDDGPPTITVTDDGHGMTLDTIRNVWLVPGDDYRRRQRREHRRTPKHGRLPIGEKGLGRFAVHKLGNKIELITRAAGADECVVTIDWQSLAEHHFLDEALVTINTRAPQTFVGASTGTRITISDLRTEWKRGEIRRLARQMTSICSPFKRTASGFRATIEVPGREGDIANLPDVAEILDRAIWTFDFTLDKGVFEWIYEFRAVPGFRVAPRTKNNLSGEMKLQLPNKRSQSMVADAATCEGIGAVTGEFYVYDRDKEILRRSPDAQLMKGYLDGNGGIRVYRDGIRVYNYGEHEDNWLGLDLRRVNVPTLRISRNIILGAIHLSLEDSTQLVEKTNREGFVENDALDRLQQIVLGALSTFEPERQLDKNRIRQATEGLVDSRTDRMMRMFTQMRADLDKGSLETLGRQLTKIERNYETMQEVLTKAGMSGLSLALVFHEVERGVRGLYSQIVAGVARDVLARQAQHLTNLLDGFSGLLRRGRRRSHSLRKLALTASQIHSLRLARHRVSLQSPLLDGIASGPHSSDDPHSKFYFSLAVGALNNLIDNAIYWLKVRWPENNPDTRKLYVGLSRDYDFGPALVVADNGIGFQGDDPVDLTRPFFTRRPTGMGLGLYYVNMAMELCGGKCVFPRPGEVSLPEEYDGSVVALLFKGA